MLSSLILKTSIKSMMYLNIFGIVLYASGLEPASRWGFKAPGLWPLILFSTAMCLVYVFYKRYFKKDYLKFDSYGILDKYSKDNFGKILWSEVSNIAVRRNFMEGKITITFSEPREKKSNPKLFEFTELKKGDLINETTFKNLDISKQQRAEILSLFYASQNQ